MDFFSTAVITVFSAILGYLFSVWRNRLRPWIAVLGFDGIRKAADRVPVSEALARAISQSWFTGTLTQDGTTLGRLCGSVETAKSWLELNGDTKARLNSGIAMLEKASTPEEIMQSVGYLLASEGISDLLQRSVLRGAIVPACNLDEQEQVRYYLDDKNNGGCYSLVFTPEVLHVGEEFGDHQYRVEGLLPLMKLIARLDRTNLLRLFNQVEPVYQRQFDVHNVVRSEAEAVIKENSRWACFFTVSNYGATPFILFPDTGKLMVKGKHIKPFVLDCRILAEDEEDENGAWVSTEGVLMLEPGATRKYSLVTKRVQKNVKGGGVVQDVFDKGEAEALIEIEVLGRDLPWKQKVRSTSLVFKYVAPNTDDTVLPSEQA